MLSNVKVYSVLNGKRFFQAEFVWPLVAQAAAKELSRIYGLTYKVETPTYSMWFKDGAQHAGHDKTTGKTVVCDKV
jgi:hypothetical protein